MIKRQNCFVKLQALCTYNGVLIWLVFFVLVCFPINDSWNESDTYWHLWDVSSFKWSSDGNRHIIWLSQALPFSGVAPSFKFPNEMTQAQSHKHMGSIVESQIHLRIPRNGRCPTSLSPHWFLFTYGPASSHSSSFLGHFTHVHHLLCPLCFPQAPPVQSYHIWRSIVWVE